VRLETVVPVYQRGINEDAFLARRPSRLVIETQWFEPLVDVSPLPDQGPSSAPLGRRKRAFSIAFPSNPLLNVLPAVAGALRDIRDAHKIGIQPKYPQGGNRRSKVAQQSLEGIPSVYTIARDRKPV
jgi:hypothetical protein